MGACRVGRGPDIRRLTQVDYEPPKRDWMRPTTVTLSVMLAFTLIAKWLSSVAIANGLDGQVGTIHFACGITATAFLNGFLRERR